MSGNHSRNKGAGYEREVVNYLREGDVRARRVPLSGATEYAKDDVEAMPSWEEDWSQAHRLECKRKKALPTWLTTALDGCTAAVVREDRGESFVLIRLSTYRDLLQ